MFLIHFFSLKFPNFALIFPNKISDQDRKRLFDSYNSNGDFIAVGESLGIKPDTARKIVKSGRVTKRQQGGKRYAKIDQEIEDYLEQMISENPTFTSFTLQQMQENSGAARVPAGGTRVFVSSRPNWCHSSESRFALSGIDFLS